jgi:hypothetical protein
MSERHDLNCLLNAIDDCLDQCARHEEYESADAAREAIRHGADEPMLSYIFRHVDGKLSEIRARDDVVISRDEIWYARWNLNPPLDFDYDPVDNIVAAVDILYHYAARSGGQSVEVRDE